MSTLNQSQRYLQCSLMHIIWPKLYRAFALHYPVVFMA